MDTKEILENIEVTLTQIHESLESMKAAMWTIAENCGQDDTYTRRIEKDVGNK